MKRIDFVKSSPYLVILFFQVLICAFFGFGLELPIYMGVCDYDTVLGTFGNIEITYNLMCLFICCYIVFEFLLGGFVSLFKWCIKHIVFKKNQERGGMCL